MTDMVMAVRWISLEEARAMYPSNGQVVMACRPTLLCLAIREATRVNAVV